MSIAEPSVPLRVRPWRHAGRGELLAPVATVALALALVLGAQLAAFHGNLTGFILFGHQFAAQTHPPPGARFAGPDGYDGQFFYVLAHDPLLLHSSTIAQLRGTSAPELFRIQRLGYPLLAFLLSGGQSGALPAALLAVNVLVLLAVAAMLAGWLSRRGLSPWWALAVALAPGMLLATLRDLSDPLSTACVLCGLLLWQARSRRGAALALTAAVLTREVMIALVAALALEVAVRAWRQRHATGAWRATLRQAWPVIVVPAVAFAVWQLYVMLRAGGPLGTAPAMVPFTNLVAEARWAIPSYGPVIGGGDAVYVALVLLAVAATARALVRGIDVMSAAAAALCISIVVPQLGDFWGDTRLSAPLFAVLLLDGLQRRDRPQVALGAAAGLLSVVFLLAL